MSKARVLVADDSSTIQKVFELAFEKENIDVVVAGNGSEAFEKVQDLRPDVVIADVNMPDMDGFELCRMIKQSDSVSSAPVYLLSSALDDFDEDLAREVGAAGRFEKPFRSEDMVSQVMNVIGMAPETADEDTFEDIDVSLESILDEVEAVADVSDDEGFERAPDFDEDEIRPSAPPKVLDLKADAVVDEELEEEDDAAMEVVSGMEELIDEDKDDSLVIGPDDDYDLLRTRRLDEDEPDEDMEATPALEVSAFEEEEEDLAAGGGVEDESTDDESYLSDEARRMLKEIEEADAGMETTEQTSVPSGESVEKAVGKALEEAVGQIELAVKDAFLKLEGGPLRDMVSDAVRNAIAEKITHERLNSIISGAIRASVSEMTPQILDTFKQVAMDVTLNIAEDLVKQTIEQIKSGN